MYYSRYLRSKLYIDIRNRVNCVKYYEMEGVTFFPLKKIKRHLTFLLKCK